MKLKHVVRLIVLGSMVTSGGVQAQAVEQRLQRLERVMNSTALIEMMQRVDTLQEEVRQLRGAVEEKDNTINAMRERQRKLYLDTDNRIAVLESGGGDDLNSLDSLDDLDDLDSFDTDTGSTTSLGSGSQPIQTTPAPRVNNDQQEKLEYQNAYDLLILGRNREAIAGFDDFLQQYPNGTYTDNAYYWLGEANYVERRFEQAIDRFNVVISEFPASRKVPDARLRKGFALYELQRYGEARNELVLVEREYRGRSIAALARRRIEQMNNAGL